MMWKPTHLTTMFQVKQTKAIHILMRYKYKSEGWMATRLRCLGNCARCETTHLKSGLGNSLSEWVVKGKYERWTWRWYSDVESHPFDILDNLKELCLSGQCKNIVLPPGLGHQILDGLFISAFDFLWGHAPANLVQFVGGKCCPHYPVVFISICSSLASLYFLSSIIISLCPLSYRYLSCSLYMVSSPQTPKLLVIGSRWVFGLKYNTVLKYSQFHLIPISTSILLFILHVFLFSIIWSFIPFITQLVVSNSASVFLPEHWSEFSSLTYLSSDSLLSWLRYLVSR